MNFEDAPVFIIASERSGTNLIRRRLTESQRNYYGPSPAHFLKNLYYQQPYYGDLEKDDNFRRFVQQAIDLCVIHFSPWHINWTADEIISDFGADSRNAVSLMHYMMNRYAKSVGADGYICKDNFLYEFSIDIASEIPGAKFIYLYRDPRDFVLSQMKRPGSIKSVARFSKLWEYEQTKSIAVASKLRSEGKCIFLSYEDFIKNEDAMIDRALGFLEVVRSGSDYSPDVIKADVHEWSNLGKETIKENSKKFLKELSNRQIAMVEAICGRQMKHLGYELMVDEYKYPGKISIIFDVMLSFLERKIKLMVSRDKSKGIVEQRGKVISRIKVNYRSDVFW